MNGAVGGMRPAYGVEDALARPRSLQTGRRARHDVVRERRGVDGEIAAQIAVEGHAHASSAVEERHGVLHARAPAATVVVPPGTPVEDGLERNIGEKAGAREAVRLAGEDIETIDDHHGAGPPGGFALPKEQRRKPGSRIDDRALAPVIGTTHDSKGQTSAA